MPKEISKITKWLELNQEEITVEKVKIITFYQSIQPGKDFMLKKPPRLPYKTDTGTGKGRLSGKRTPLPYRLVESYTDLGIAIKTGDWGRAKSIARYLKRMLE
jgi:hypothetical protein